MGWHRRLFPLGLMLALAACGARQQHGILGSDISGADVEQQIAARDVLMLKAFYPNSTVGKPQCPAQIDVAYGETGECTVAVDGRPVHFTVAASANGQNAFTVTQSDGIIGTESADRQITAELFRGYGRWFTVRCPGRALIVPLNEYVSCPASLPGTTIDHVDAVMDRDNPGVSVTKVAGLRNMLDATFGASLRSGQSTMPGAAVEPYVRDLALTEVQGRIYDRPGIVGAVRCPSRISLALGAHTTCVARIAGQSVPYDIERTSARVVVSTSLAGVDLTWKDRFITRLYHVMAASHGAEETYAITCRPDGIVFVVPGTTLPCMLTSARGERRPIGATVVNMDGYVSYNSPRETAGRTIYLNDVARAIAAALGTLFH